MTFVTGTAWRMPLGSSIDGAMDRLYAGERAAVAPDPARSRHARFLRRMGLLACEVGSEALARAGVPRGDRLGLFFGYGGLRAHWNEIMPALANQREDAAGAWERGLRLLHPFWMLHHLSNNAHALLSIDVNARGEGATYGGANAGAQALEAATRALADGAVDAALVVAYDSLVEPETLIDLGARGALGPGAPYAAASNGFVPGEAAAALVLERSGEIRLSAATAADGASGAPAAATLAALARPADLVDGAALGDRAFDDAERAAVAAVTGADTPLIATLAATGQVGGAAAVVQAVALVEVLRRGLLPPIAGLAAAAPGPLVPVTAARPTAARSALALSVGAPGLAGAVFLEVA